MKKLRIKIVSGVFLSALVVFVLTIIFLGLSSQININNHADATTELISKNNGSLPMFSDYKLLDENDRIRTYNYDAETPFRFRYFVVLYDNDDGQYSYSADIDHIASVDEDEAIEKAASVIKAERVWAI